VSIKKWDHFANEHVTKIGEASTVGEGQGGDEEGEAEVESG